LPPLQDDIIRYHGQPVALVVADTFERATHAATLVRVTYREEPAVLDFAAAPVFPPGGQKSSDRGSKKAIDYQRGDPDGAYAAAEVKVEATYTHPAEHHNPMEMHATLAAWDGGRLTLYDKTQWVDNVRQQVALAFGLAEDN